MSGRSLLKTAYEQLVLKAGNPYFELNSSQIEIKQSPVDLFLAIAKGVRISYSRCVLSTLYIGDGPLEQFITGLLFNKLEANKALKLSILCDYNRGRRANFVSAYSLMQPLKRNFPPNPNVRIGFYKSPLAPILLSGSNALSEVFGVQHMKVAVFDDHVVMTGANLSENYFTDRQDRVVIFKNAPKLADFCEDLINSMIDCSMQITETGVMEFPQDMPHYTSPLSASGKKEFNKLQEDRIKMLKFMYKPKERLEFEDFWKSHTTQKKEAAGSQDSQAPTDLALFEAKEWGQKLKMIGKSSDVFNVLKDMPTDLNIIDGTGGWNNQLAPLGEKVYLFPSLQIATAKVNDDLEFTKELLKTATDLKITSGYMNFPKALRNLLKDTKVLKLLCASPNANGFLGDGVKNWIPYFYRALCQLHYAKLPNAQISEYEKGLWTFHAKGLWAYEEGRPFLSSIGSSNFARRSYVRDTEFQLYMWSACPSLQQCLDAEVSHLWSTSKEVSKDTFKDQFKTGLITKALARVLARFL
mmetsp:Transcript_17314/g.31199  ORF Transcript_17314/g.31199 Transcript_17314/m.31199 type:complete len:526 (-) Transcript_17314:554-2131(-)|eukprot:CAMPEP_0204903302 /NCGR_PEP_ID=MMETSP1397-20131031/4169_1 /ASSEMBLY_ACC=CAM_ASM_000891 /TAXON_ID=49980 /ORGANISM="Climacostomum Climacostomum virens, Strain Stock W-24" /LENGTH=525 /DNA_ID=CAMNT_0052071911 /DNA_START=999 /DNA_END=2576 /DNA_ORIENTATION=-